MIQKTAEYRVDEDKLQLVEGAIREFVAAIAREEPQTYYAAYRSGDGADFIHFMAFPDASAEAFHRSAPHTLRFVEVLYPACEEQPRFTDLHSVASTNHQQGEGSNPRFERD